MTDGRVARSRPDRRVFRVTPALVFLAIAWTAAHSPAQCASRWQPGSFAGTSGPVYAATWWDRDGGGPLLPALVVAGGFTTAGATVASRVAWLDASNQWQALGAGLDGDVFALAALPNGDLVVGGAFASAGGTSAHSIARWDGRTWSALGSGMNAPVYAVAVLPNGDLVAGGDFTSAGGASVARIARFSGGAWSSLGTGFDNAPLQNASVKCLLTMPSGDLIAGGVFNNAGGTYAVNVARWDGTSWSAIGGGVAALFPALPGGVWSLALLPGGDLIVGGRFNWAGLASASNVARWDGSAWSALGGGPGASDVSALAITVNGELLASGSSELKLWNGTSWTSIGGPKLGVNAFASDGAGTIAAGGSFLQPGNYLALWNGGAWSALGTPSLSGAGFGGHLLAAVERPNGDPIVGGVFNAVGGVAVTDLARWNGSSWSSIGASLLPPPFTSYTQVGALATSSNGDLVAGGYFESAGKGIVRWNGSTWSALGGGLSPGHTGEIWVNGIASLSGGGLIAVGIFSAAGSSNIARWDGASWSGYGAGLTGSLDAAIVLPNGRVVACGILNADAHTPAGNIAQWDGARWTALGSGMNGEVSALALLPNGDLIAGGWFSMAGLVSARNVARWDGSAWSPLGAGLGDATSTVQALLTLPDGEVLAGGSFRGPGGVDLIARWDGGTWNPVAGGMGGGVGTSVNDLLLRANGDVLAAGSFQTAGGVAAQDVAVLRVPCPAMVSAFGAGCTGSGGLNQLVASNLPWTGSTFVTRANGMPSSGAAVFLYGLVPSSTPLTTLLSGALSGCVLSVLPVIALPLPVVAGSATMIVQVQSNPALAGMQIREQVLAVGTNASGNIVQVTSTNALQITIGSF